MEESDLIETVPPQTIADLATSGSAAEFRAVREGKTVADVVKAREEPPAADREATPAENEPRRDEAGRFAKAEEKSVEAVAKAEAPTTTGQPRKEGDPRLDPHAKKQRIQDEINLLTKQKGETQRERDAIAAELASLRAERDALKAPPKTEQAKPAADDDDFDFPEYSAWLEQPGNDGKTYEQYTRAMVRAMRDHERTLEQASKQQQETLTALQTAWKPFHDREPAFKAEHPDYDTVIAKSPVAELQLPPWVLAQIRDAENGPQLRYYLAQHADETQWIASLSKVAAERYLSNLFTAEPAAPTVTATPPPQSKADPPFETVGASASASSRSVETVAAKGTAADYRRLREGGAR